jgi:hypothetical protein
MPLLDDFVAELNAHRFLKEFSFRKNTFLKAGVGTLEVADHIVWLSDLLFVFQLKERQGKSSNVATWIRKQVLKEATRQIRGTLGLVSASHPVLVTNDRGDTFDFRDAKGAHVFKMIVFRLPDVRVTVLGPRYHDSRTAGFIHILNWPDYRSLVQTLLTPIEIADYLAFRESLLPATQTIPSEEALLGQYLLDRRDVKPDERFAGALDALIADQDRFDLTWFLDGMAVRTYFETGGPRSYYRILEEMAKLTRTELGHLKQRLSLAMDAAKENRFARPYRFVAPRTDCGFMILPLTHELVQRRLAGLKMFTLAAKYDQRTSRQVGISVACERREFLIDFAFDEGSWQYNAELDERLRSNYPFRELKTQLAPKYSFRTDDLDDRGLL